MFREVCKSNSMKLLWICGWRALGVLCLTVTKVHDSVLEVRCHPCFPNFLSPSLLKWKNKWQTLLKKWVLNGFVCSVFMKNCHIWKTEERAHIWRCLVVWEVAILENTSKENIFFFNYCTFLLLLVIFLYFFSNVVCSLYTVLRQILSFLRLRKINITLKNHKEKHPLKEFRMCSVVNNRICVVSWFVKHLRVSYTYGLGNLKTLLFLESIFSVLFLLMCIRMGELLCWNTCKTGCFQLLACFVTIKFQIITDVL